jgi:hypothetical protein
MSHCYVLLQQARPRGLVVRRHQRLFFLFFLSSLLITKDFDEETTTGNDDIRSRVNLRLVFENEEDDEEQQQQQKRKQREIKMELTLSQFYEFKRDLEIARKSLNDAEGEV